MDERDAAQALTRLPDKFAFLLSACQCAVLPVGLFLAFSSLAPEENVLVTRCVLTMKCLIAPNFIAWAFLTAFSWARSTTTTTTSAASKKTRIKLGYLFKCMLSMGFLTLFLHVFIVLFGAPLTVEVNETFHLAALAASLSLWPCIFTYGLQWESWVTSICVFEGSPLTGIDGCVSLGGKGALLGLWMGAIPIPLDWDRPWQQWPTTCVIGTLIGHVVGLTCHVAATLRTMRKDVKRNKIV